MTVIITGSRGQLGRSLMQRLADRGTGLDLPEFDLCDPRQVQQQIAALRPQVVINCAAYTQVDRAESEPERCLATNATAVGYLAEACRQVDALLVQISTDYVFGGDRERKTPYAEADPPAPLSIYGRSKWLGEQAAARCPRHLVVRTCGLYAYSPQVTNFVEKMLELAATRPRLRVVHDQWCSPTYVEHLSDALLYLCAAGAQGVYHVVNQGAVTWFEFAAEILRRQPRAIDLEPIRSHEYPAAAERPGYSVLSTDKYHALPGPAMPTWQEALQAYFAARPQPSS